MKGMSLNSDLQLSDSGTSSDSNSESSESGDEIFESISFETCNKDQQTHLKLLQCFMKHNFSASACKDILNFIPGDLSYDKLLKQCGIGDFVEVHYCEVCSAVFPREHEDTLA